MELLLGSRIVVALFLWELLEEEGCLTEELLLLLEEEARVAEVLLLLEEELRVAEVLFC